MQRQTQKSATLRNRAVHCFDAQKVCKAAA